MKRMFLIMGIVAMSAMYAPSAKAQSASEISCFDTLTFPSLLQNRYGEMQMWTGTEFTTGSHIRMYMNPVSKTFTISTVPYDSTHLECVLLAGENFKVPVVIQGEDS
jgi:hypothetical protein